MNGWWIRSLPLKELEAATLPLAEARYGERLDLHLLRSALEIGQERSVTLGALLDQADLLFVDDDQFKIAPESWEKAVHTDRVGEIFDAVLARLRTCEWTLDG